MVLAPQSEDDMKPPSNLDSNKVLKKFGIPSPDSRLAPYLDASGDYHIPGKPDLTESDLADCMRDPIPPTPVDPRDAKIATLEERISLLEKKVLKP